MEIKKARDILVADLLPEQNLIETLWKSIKYEWIEVEAYENWNSLLKYLKKVLDNLGDEYVINFA